MSGYWCSKVKFVSQTISFIASLDYVISLLKVLRHHSQTFTHIFFFTKPHLQDHSYSIPLWWNSFNLLPVYKSHFLPIWLSWTNRISPFLLSIMLTNSLVYPIKVPKFLLYLCLSFPHLFPPKIKIQFPLVSHRPKGPMGVDQIKSICLFGFHYWFGFCFLRCPSWDNSSNSTEVLPPCGKFIFYFLFYIVHSTDVNKILVLKLCFPFLINNSPYFY